MALYICLIICGQACYATTFTLMKSEDGGPREMSKFHTDNHTTIINQSYNNQVLKQMNSTEHLC